MTSGRSAAYNLAEAGLNNAMSVLRLPTNNALDRYVFCADAASLPTTPVPTHRHVLCGNGRLVRQPLPEPRGRNCVLGSLLDRPRP